LRLGITKHFPDDESHLPPESITIAELLQGAGYRTAHVGKWHLGGLHQAHIDNRAASIPGPLQHGFDHYLTQLEDPPVRVPLGREKRMYRDGGQHLVRDDENAPADSRYYTDINGDEAMAYIEKFHAEGKPFFVNVWFLAPHMPYEPAPEPFYGMYEGWASGDQRKFRSMLSAMDHKIGQILAKLDELGIADNTLVVFTSDNGGAYEADIGPWKGGKTDLHDGGMRVPYIARWPGVIPAGVVSHELAAHADLLPTVCAATGVQPPPNLDGVNLLPHLRGGAPVLGRGPLFWQMDLYEHVQRHYDKPKPYATEAVRDGRWKLLARAGEPVELFDVEADPRERENLLFDYPGVAARLKAALAEFLAAPRMNPKP
jgi:N-acetylgalactosamine-6-sulfatase